MNFVLKNNLLRKGLAGAAGAVIAIASLSACTDYVAQMESDFEVWASQQGGTYPQGGDYPEWGGDEIPPSNSSTSYTSSIVTGSLLDERDGQIYKTVLIGKQVWMAQNLNYASDFYRSYCYDDLSSNCAKYGRLYSWAAAMDSLGVFSTNGKGCGYKVSCSISYPVRGICPAGWHLPSKEEWEVLLNAVGGEDNAGTKLKSSTDWLNGGNGLDSYGFNALPAGMQYETLGSENIGEDAGFVTSSEYVSSGLHYDQYVAHFYDSVTWVTIQFSGKNYGYSVRCVQN